MPVRKQIQMPRGGTSEDRVNVVGRTIAEVVEVLRQEAGYPPDECCSGVLAAAARLAVRFGREESAADALEALARMLRSGAPIFSDQPRAGTASPRWRTA